LYEEILTSKKRITDQIGIEPKVFAFPNGLYNLLSMQIVKESGYKVALLCDDKVSNFQEYKNENCLYVLPRIMINQSNWKEENLRILGFHQKLKSMVKREPYISNQLI